MKTITSFFVFLAFLCIGVFAQEGVDYSQSLSNLSYNQKKELANKIFPVYQKRFEINVRDTILVKINDACNVEIDTALLKYPEDEREAKKNEIWSSITKLKKYQKFANYSTLNYYVTPTGLATVIDNYSSGTIGRAVNIWYSQCEKALYQSANSVFREAKTWLDENY